jgi:hypothetical protein
MTRVVLVSNRVLDLSKATRAGGVAVVLANIVRTRKVLWFGWNGEVKPADKIDVVERQGRIATSALSDIDYAGYYLGYANSVLWPVFRRRRGQQTGRSKPSPPGMNSDSGLDQTRALGQDVKHRLPTIDFVGSFISQALLTIFRLPAC